MLSFIAATSVVLLILAVVVSGVYFLSGLFGKRKPVEEADLAPEEYIDREFPEPVLYIVAKNA
jgi:hypothetical protein